MVDKVKKGLFANLGADLGAGLVVFFVAVPLCLGIALASGAPLFSGIVAGIVGGLVVGSLSNSNLSVTGPAAGLAAIVVAAITELGVFEIFLCAGIIAGAVQLILGFLKAGSIANYFPSNVIEGMLAGIGIIIILKQIPYALGTDAIFEGGEAGSPLSSIVEALRTIAPGAIIISLISVAIMLIWDRVEFLKKIKGLPAPLVAVVVGVVINEVFISTGSNFALDAKHLVNLPVADSLAGFFGLFTLPDLNGFLDSRVWMIGFTIAIVASIETLLCIEATDRLDPQKRYTSTSRELKAQGVGNMVSSFIGGLPVTSVIVRSSANVNAGGKSKLSTIFHGLLILVSAALVPVLLNKIPLAVLASILVLTGYKLAKPALFKKWFASGIYQFTPFLVTIVGIVTLDLLKGVALGMVVSIFFILRENLKTPYFFQSKEYKEGDIIHINLAQEVSFLNKAAIKLTLENLPEDSYVIMDASDTAYMDHDVVELIKEFIEYKAKEKDIRVDTAGFLDRYGITNTIVNGNAAALQEADLEHAGVTDTQVTVVKPNRKYSELIARFKGGKGTAEA